GLALERRDQMVRRVETRVLPDREPHAARIDPDRWEELITGSRRAVRLHADRLRGAPAGAEVVGRLQRDVGTRDRSVGVVLIDQRARRPRVASYAKDGVFGNRTCPLPGRLSFAFGLSANHPGRSTRTT